MQIKGLNKLCALCKLNNLKTLGELRDFYMMHKLTGEDVITTLKRKLDENALIMLQKQIKGE